MTIPTTRDDFKTHCLRRLGAPVIEINLDDDQIDDRVDEALQYFWDYHFDGTEKTYYKYQLLQSDIDNQYITMPANIIGAINIFPIGSALQTNNMFNIRYQIALNDLYTLTSVSMVPYYMAMTHLAVLEQMLVGQQPIRYNRHNNRLYIDMSWDQVDVGTFLLVEAYQILDPEVYSGAWGDRWLQRYATCLMKQQWGTNLKKFEGVQLPGGVRFNGQAIYNEATIERTELEHEAIYTFSGPNIDMIGAIAIAAVGLSALLSGIFSGVSGLIV